MKYLTRRRTWLMGGLLVYALVALVWSAASSAGATQLTTASPANDIAAFDSEITAVGLRA